ncbi:hypothetical protein IFR05_014842 [Cadophora sp. M221]|nr:hypothetical protein IFR05_014842 [Cadophora sp. M221]
MRIVFCRRRLHLLLVPSVRSTADHDRSQEYKEDVDIESDSESGDGGQIHYRSQSQSQSRSHASRNSTIDPDDSLSHTSDNPLYVLVPQNEAFDDYENASASLEPSIEGRDAFVFQQVRISGSESKERENYAPHPFHFRKGGSASQLSDWDDDDDDDDDDDYEKNNYRFSRKFTKRRDEFGRW